jgi:hypothetical protein
MPDERSVDVSETLLENEDGSIVVEAPEVLVCDCQGAGLDLAAQLVSTFALVATTIITTLVAVRAAPWTILLISMTWCTGALLALTFVRRRRLLHGRVRIDFAAGEGVHEGKGFSATFPVTAIEGISMPVVAGPEGEPSGEPGYEPRWLLLHLAGGRRVRLGRGPGFSLRPAVVFFRKAGIAVLPG